MSSKIEVSVAKLAEQYEETARGPSPGWIGAEVVARQLRSILAAPVVERQPVPIQRLSECDSPGMCGDDEYGAYVYYEAHVEIVSELQATIAHLDRNLFRQSEQIAQLKAEIERLKGGQGEPVALSVPDECPHLIVFDDTDRENLLFAGAGARSAALKTWGKISMSWNANLFVRVERNSRDDRYPSATVSTSQPAPVSVVLPTLISSEDGPHYSNNRASELGYLAGYNACLDKVKELNQSLVIAVDPGKPGSDMTAKATFTREDGKLILESIEYSEPVKLCAASIGDTHCHVPRVDGSLFCGQHRHADSRQPRAPLTNEGLAFMMQRDGEQQ